MNVAGGLLALARGATPDYGGREHPNFQGRLMLRLVLPHALVVVAVVVIVIIIIIIIISAFQLKTEIQHSELKDQLNNK